MIPFKSYKITDLFSVNNTHNILKTDVEFDSGNIPYVTAGEGNNSIASYISYDTDLLEPGNSIMIGGKTMVITYQPKSFFSNDSHNLVLRYKDNQELSENESLFMVTALYRSLSHKYHWGDSISKAKIKSDFVNLPTTQNGDVDFETMTILINAIKKVTISKVKEFIENEQRAYLQVYNAE